MKHISILVPTGAVALGCIEGSYKLFNKINDFLIATDKQPMFKIQLVGMNGEPQEYDRFFNVQPDLTIKDKFKTDLVVIPAVNGDMEKVIADNKIFFPWMIDQYHNGAEIASLCVGAFLLASTGLVDGKKCSTHWGSANAFSNMFPNVELVADKVVTDENGIYSSGGANSFWNLLLYIVEKYCNREVAILASKYFAIEIDRTSQSAFIMFKGQNEHSDDAVRQAQQFIEKNFQEKIAVAQLSAMLAIGRRSFERRFKKVTSNTVIEYIQRVKIEAAKKSFETSRKNISEVMYDVGYSDTKAFRTVFKRTTGLSPVEYRNKYNKEAYA